MDSDKILILETQVILLHVGRINILEGVYQAELKIVAKWMDFNDQESLNFKSSKDSLKLKSSTLDFAKGKKAENNKISSREKLIKERSGRKRSVLDSERQKKETETTEAKGDPWTPDFRVENSMGNLVILHKKVSIDASKKNFWVQDLVVWGEFFFDPQTIYFPFDIQSLNLIFYCSNSENRKVMMVNSLRLLHYVKQEFNNHLPDFTVYDAIESATTTDQDHSRRNFSVLIVTFFVSTKLSLGKVKWIILPYLFTLVAVVSLFTENAFLHDRILTNLLLLFFILIIRIFCKLPVFNLTILDMYIILSKFMVICNIAWLILETYQLCLWGRAVLTSVYLVALAMVTFFLYYAIWKLKASIITNSILYKENLSLIVADNALELEASKQGDRTSVYSMGLYHKNPSADKIRFGSAVLSNRETGAYNRSHRRPSGAMFSYSATRASTIVSYPVLEESK